MDQKKRILIVVVLLFVIVGAVLGVDYMRRRQAASQAPADMPPGSIPIFVDGKFVASFVPDDLSQMESASFVDDEEAPDLPILGKIADITEIVTRHDIDEVIIALPSAAYETVERVVYELQELPVRIRPAGLHAPGQSHRHRAFRGNHPRGPTALPQETDRNLRRPRRHRRDRMRRPHDPGQAHDRRADQARRQTPRRRPTQNPQHRHPGLRP